MVFFQTKGGAARETLSWEEGHCVGYEEEFQEGSSTTGSYVCHIVIAAPKLTMSPGGPPQPFVAPAPREHGTPPQEGLAGPFVVPLLTPPVPPAPPAPVVAPLGEAVAETAGKALLGRIWQGVLRTLTSAPAMTVGLLLLATNSKDDAGYQSEWNLFRPERDRGRLAYLKMRHAAGTLTATEEAEMIDLLAKVKGIRVKSLAELPNVVPVNVPRLPFQAVTNKFPKEPLPADGKIIPYEIIDGNIKGVNGKRQFDFIINSEGKLVIGSKHHLLGNGQAVQGAGQLRLNGKGQVRQIDNLSGHYQPTVAQTANYPGLLQQTGLNVKGTTIVTHSISTNSSGMVTGIKVVSSKIIK